MGATSGPLDTSTLPNDSVGRYAKGSVDLQEATLRLAGSDPAPASRPAEAQLDVIDHVSRHLPRSKPYFTETHRSVTLSADHANRRDGEAALWTTFGPVGLRPSNRKVRGTAGQLVPCRSSSGPRTPGRRKPPRRISAAGSPSATTR